MVQTLELLWGAPLGVGVRLKDLLLRRRAPGLQLRVRLRPLEYARERDRDRDLLLEWSPLRRAVSRSYDGLLLLLFAVRGDTERRGESTRSRGDATGERPRGGIENSKLQV